MSRISFSKAAAYSDDNYVVVSALYMALLQKVFNSKNIQVVSAPIIDKIDPRVKVKRIMSAEKLTTAKISLDTLPDSLVTYIGDFCNLSSLATLSISYRKMSQLIRVRPLEPPQGGFSVLKKEAAAIIHRMEKIQHTSPFMVGHDTVHPHLPPLRLHDILTGL